MRTQSRVIGEFVAYRTRNEFGEVIWTVGRNDRKGWTAQSRKLKDAYGFLQALYGKGAHVDAHA